MIARLWEGEMKQKDEIELEEEQRVRLLNAFQQILTYDDREKVIEFCEATLSAGPEFFRRKD